MSRLVDFTLTSEQLAEIEQAINYSPQPEVRQRAIAIRLLHLGYKPEQVSERVAIRANTIWTWHRRWRKEGLAGLHDHPRSGRKRKATPEYQQLLQATLETDPTTHGYAFTVWTMARLRSHLRDKTGIDLSRARFSVLMSE
jgi:transposase